MNTDIIRAIEERRTTVLFDASRSLTDQQISEIVRLAARSPSSFNLQNWRFIAVRSAESKQRLREVAWNQEKVTAAAVTFIVCGQLADEKTLPERLKPAVEAGIMPKGMIEGWVKAAASLYANQQQRQRDEAVRSASLGAMTLMLTGLSLA